MDQVASPCPVDPEDPEVQFPDSNENLDRHKQDSDASACPPHGWIIGSPSRLNTVSNYRARLIEAGLIEQAGYGRVDFAIPGLREYLRARPA
ncbi:hypothetical protein [Sinomonas mesophila]|uniref:hypothetical protein n=1 Tax=Sinomonas mesophila TaxID=1531955 RepID=UPI001FE415E9|nr:hypothetical protein [Sinomonas mesophila]